MNAQRIVCCIPSVVNIGTDFLKIYILQGNVAAHAVKVFTRGHLIGPITSLQIFRRMCQWNNFENRSIFGEDVDNSWMFTL